MEVLFDKNKRIGTLAGENKSGIRPIVQHLKA